MFQRFALGRPSWLFALMMLPMFLLASCGQGDESKSGATATTQSSSGSAKKLKIGVSIPSADHGWTAGVGWWAQRTQADFPDVEWFYATADKPEKQIADIQDMLAQHVDGVVILATESAALTPIAQRVKDRGVFIVNVDRGFLKNDIADIFLAGDNAAFGRKSAEFVAQRLNAKGKIVLMRGISSTVDTARYEAAMEVFKKSPGIEVLAAQPGQWSQQKALEVMQSYLTQFPHIDAVWASDDDMALGAEKAIRSANRQKEMWILGGAGMKDIVKRVADKDPTYPADITYPPEMIAGGMILAVANLRDGNEQALADKLPASLGIDKSMLRTARAPKDAKAAQREVKLDVQLITPENAGKFYFKDSAY